jgi:hypothetical protein
MSDLESHTLAFPRRLDDKLDRVIADIGDLKADMEVQSAIIRRLDHSVQNLTGEVRALAGQQDRQRQKLERLERRIDELGPLQPA